ncbi:hypothetical protein [Marinobacterium litorale]|uniref:hypothetical protein n=1 Tax=Marinobacterium litorale TaxID=404770 RepID=UPI00041FA99C|nr:hypothetical protein [Marinobacterium litorale]
MSYTAPAGNAVNFDFTGAGYTPPAGDAVDFVFGAPVEITASATLPAFTSGLSLEHVQPRDITAAATLPAPAWQIELNHAPPGTLPREITASATLPAVQPAIELAWFPDRRVDARAILPGGITANVELTWFPEHLLTPVATLPGVPSASVTLDFDPTRRIDPRTTLPPITADVQLARGHVITSAVATLPPITADVKLAWGVRIPGTTLIAASTADDKAGIRWGDGAKAENGPRMGYNDAPKKEPTISARWIDAPRHEAEPTIPHGTLPQFDTERTAPHGDLSRWADRNPELPSNYPLPTDLLRYQLWADFDRTMDRDHSDPWNYPIPTDKTKLQPFHRVDDYGQRLIWDTRDYTPPRRYAVNFDFGGGYYTPPAGENVQFSWGAANPYEDQPVRPVDPGLSISHNAPPPREHTNEIVWGDGYWERPLPDYIAEPGWTAEPPEEADRPEQPDIREVYIFMPHVTLYRMPDGTEIEALGVSWSTDADSWAWRFNATLKRESDLALLKPDTNGPREIGCEINGHLFTGMVTSYAPTRSFGQTRIQISGASLSRWLSDPYAPKRSKLITSAYNAMDLAEQELQYTGWTLDWQTADWLVPGNVHTYDQLAPISAIKQLASSVDAIVQSHPSDKTLIIKPRYPFNPHRWAEGSTALAAILPAAMIQQISAQYVSRPLYNKAIVAGGKTGGVLVTVVREGTAGDVLAPQVVDKYITAMEAGQERGRNAIAAGGEWEQMRFATKLTESGDAPGLMLPGHMVEIQDTGETYPVQITGTTINVENTKDRLRVDQILSADRSVTHA